jgi:hypothetical protein
MGKRLDLLTAATAFGVAAYVAIIMDCVACGQLGWSDGEIRSIALLLQPASRSGWRWIFWGGAGARQTECVRCGGAGPALTGGWQKPRQGARDLQRRRRTAILPGRGLAEGSPSRLVFQGNFSMEAILKSFIGMALVSLALAAPALAQGLVDPSKVAPEYREAAEKRRAEQIKQRDCAKKAEAEKVMPRERTTFLLHCLDEMAASAPGTPASPASTTAVTAPAPSAANATTTH